MIYIITDLHISFDDKFQPVNSISPGLFQGGAAGGGGGGAESARGL